MQPASVDHVEIWPWLERADRAQLESALDEVFFVSSGTQSFPGDAERRAFRQRWLGRYLEHYPRWAYVALGGDGALAGYLVGSLDDPAKTPLFGDIAYFQALAPLTAIYPAQLHVNLAPQWRSRGVGARLVQRFVHDAAAAGAPGVHVVTGAGLRNVGFYARNGFEEVGRLDWSGRELVMLARRLQPAGGAA